MWIFAGGVIGNSALGGLFSTRCRSLSRVREQFYPRGFSLGGIRHGVPMLVTKRTSDHLSRHRTAYFREVAKEDARVDWGYGWLPAWCSNYYDCPAPLIALLELRLLTAPCHLLRNLCCGHLRRCKASKHHCFPRIIATRCRCRDVSHSERARSPAGCCAPRHTSDGIELGI